jgi:ABC-2 type transport system permease protein
MSSASAPAIPAQHASAAMPRQRVWRAYLTEARFEIVNGFRSPNTILFTLGFPVMFYLLAGFIFGFLRARDPGLTAYMLIGFTLMAVMTPGFMTLGVALAIERDQGLHTLRRALPMPAAANFVGKIVLALACVAVTVPVVMAIGVFLGNVSLSVWQLLAIWALALLGALPFCALGFFIGMRSSARAAAPVTNLFFIPMIYLSGALFPVPQAVKWVSVLTPPFYLQQLMLAVADANHRFVGGLAVHVGILVAFTVVLALLTVRRFSAVG